MEAAGQLVTTAINTEKKLDRSKIWTEERLAKFHWLMDSDTPEAAALREKMKAILTN